MVLLWNERQNVEIQIKQKFVSSASFDCKVMKRSSNHSPYDGKIRCSQFLILVQEQVQPFFFL